MDTLTIPTTTTRPPAPTEPPAEVRLRTSIPGADHRILQFLAIETGASVSALVVEGVKMLVRWYGSQGLPTARATTDANSQARGAT
jgi:hypothetical protein